MKRISDAIACVARGIVSAREIKFWTSERRSREENGERDSEIPPARKLEFFECSLRSWRYCKRPRNKVLDRLVLSPH